MQWHRKLNWLTKNPLSQLEGSTSNIKDLFNDILDETKGFKLVWIKLLSKSC